MDVDESGERMQKKILRAQQAKAPYMLVVGDQEAAAGTVAIRRRDGVTAPGWGVEAFAQALCDEIGGRRITPGIAS